MDTDGSIVFNYNSNRIECVIEVKNNEYSIKLCLDDLIPGQNPYKLIRLKSSSQSRRFASPPPRFPAPCRIKMKLISFLCENSWILHLLSCRIKIQFIEFLCDIATGGAQIRDLAGTEFPAPRAGDEGTRGTRRRRTQNLSPPVALKFNLRLNFNAKSEGGEFSHKN